MSQNNISKAQVENIEAITQLTADNKLVLVQKNGAGDEYDYIKKTTGIVEKPEEGSLDLITSGGVEKYILPKKYNYESSNIKLGSPQAVQLLNFTMSGYHNRGGNLNTLTLALQGRSRAEEVISSNFYVVVTDGEHSYVSKEKNSSTSGECVFTFDEDSFVVSGKDLLVYFVETRDANAQKVCVKLDSAMKEVFDSSWCTVSFLETGGKYVRVNDVTPYFKLSVVQSETMQHFPTGDVHTTDIEREKWNNKISQLTFKRELGDYGESVSQVLSWFAIGTQHMKLPAHQDPITIVKISVNKGDNSTPSGITLTRGDLKMIVWQFAGDGDKSFVALSKNSVNVYEQTQGEKITFEFEPFVFDVGYSLRCAFVDAENPSWWNDSTHVSLMRYVGEVTTANDGRQTRIVGTGDSNVNYGRIVLADVYYGCGSNVDTEPIEESMAPVTSDALYKHVHNTDIHITEEEKEAIERLVIDTEVTKDSPNLITSGAVYKDNEFLYGSDIQEDWMVGKEIHRINNGSWDNRGNSMFSYKPIDPYFYRDTKIASLEIPLKYNEGETPYSSPVKLLVYGVNGTNDDRYDVANLTFVGLSSNSLNIADDIEKMVFEFETPFGGFDEYLFGIVDATKADALYADSSNNNAPIGYYDGTGVDEDHRILVDVRIGAIYGTGAEGEEGYHTWRTPWNTETMTKGEWGYNIVPVKFHTASYKGYLDDIKYVIHVTQDDAGYNVALGEGAVSTNNGISIGDSAHSNDGTISLGSNSGALAIAYDKDGGNNINIGSSTHSIGNTNIAIGFGANVGSANDKFDAVPLSNSVSIGRCAKTTASNATAIGLSAENNQSGTLLLRASSTALLGNDGEKYADFILDCDGNVKVEKTVIIGGEEKTITDTIVTEDSLEELDFFDKVEITKTDKELTDISTFVLSFTMNTFSYKALTGDLYDSFTKGINKIGCVFGACTPVDFRMLVLGVGDKRSDAATRFRLDNLSFLGLSNKVESRAIANGEVVYFDFDTSFFMPETKEVLVMFIKGSVASRFDDKQVHNVSSTDCATIKVGLLRFNNSQLNDNYHWWGGSYNLETMGAGNANGYALDLRFFGIIDIPHPKNTDVHFDDATQKGDVIDHLTDASMHFSQADRERLNNAVQESELSGYVTATTFNTHTSAGIHFDDVTQKSDTVNHRTDADMHFDSAIQKQNVTEHLCPKNAWMHFDNNTQKTDFTTHLTNNDIHFASKSEKDTVTDHVKNLGTYKHLSTSDVENIVNNMGPFALDSELEDHIANNDVHFTDQEQKCSVMRHIENTCIHHTKTQIEEIVDGRMGNYALAKDLTTHIADTTAHFTGTEKADMKTAINNMTAHMGSGGLHFDGQGQKTLVTNHVDKESTCFTTWHLKDGDREKIDNAIDEDTLNEALGDYVLITTFEGHTNTADIHFDGATQKNDTVNHRTDADMHFDSATQKTDFTTHLTNNDIHFASKNEKDCVTNHVKNLGTYQHLSTSDVETIVDGKMGGYVTIGTFNTHAEAECIHFADKEEKCSVLGHIENTCIHVNADEKKKIHDALTASDLDGYVTDGEFTCHVNKQSVHFVGTEKNDMQTAINNMTTHIGSGSLHFDGQGQKTSVTSHVDKESTCFTTWHLTTEDRCKIAKAIDADTLNKALGDYVLMTTFEGHTTTNDVHFDDATQKTNVLTATNAITTHIGNSGIHVTAQEKTDIAKIDTHINDGTIHHTQSDIESIVNGKMSGYVTTTTFMGHTEAKCLHFESSCQKNIVITHTDVSDENFYIYHLKDGDREKIDTAVDQATLNATLEGYVTDGEFNCHVENSCMHHTPNEIEGIVEGKMAEYVTSDAFNNHINSGVHFSSADERSCVINHLTDNTRHLTGEERCKINDAVTSSSVRNMVALSQSEYDSLEGNCKRPDTFYIIWEG